MAEDDFEIKPRKRASAKSEVTLPSVIEILEHLDGAWTPKDNTRQLPAAVVEAMSNAAANYASAVNSYSQGAHKLSRDEARDIGASIALLFSDSTYQEEGSKLEAFFKECQGKARVRPTFSEGR